MKSNLLRHLAAGIGLLGAVASVRAQVPPAAPPPGPAASPADIVPRYTQAPLTTRQARVKDIVTVKGAREDYLVGEALVVGLDGNGDNPKGSAAQRLRVFLKNHAEWTIDEKDLNSKNVAMVMVTATLPAFLEKGQRFDVRVHAIGDAKSLKGGTMLPAMLRAPVPIAVNPTVYAIAQGPIAIDNDDRGGNPTTGAIQGGAFVEVPLGRSFVENGEWITLNLNDPDFNVAFDVVEGILQRAADIGEDWNQYKARAYGLARAVSAGEIVLRLPPEFRQPESQRETLAVQFLSKVLSYTVTLGEPAPAKVVINDKSKTVVVTGQVMVMPCGIRTRNLSLVIDEPMNLLYLINFSGAAAPANAAGPAPQLVLSPASAPDRGRQDLAARLAPQGLIGPQDLVDIVRELHRARMISATVIVE